MLNKTIQAAILICIVYFLIYQRNRYISIFDSPETNPYTYTTDFIKGISSSARNRVRLVILNQNEKLNSNPEISKMMGFLGGEAYIFQFINSLNGLDFKVQSLSEYCETKTKDIQYLFILSPLVLKEVGKDCPKTNIKILNSGYGLYATEEIIDEIFKKFPFEDVLSSNYIEIDLNPENLFKHESDVGLLIRDWGVKKQVLVLSKNREAFLKINNKNTQFGKLIYADSPSNSVKSDYIAKSSTKTLFYDNVGRPLGLESFGGMHLTEFGPAEMRIIFSESDFNNHFGKYMLIMHDPKLRFLNNMEN